MIFNIGGNKYRLATRIAYRSKIAYLKWVGTHEEYDEQDIAGRHTVETSAIHRGAG